MPSNSGKTFPALLLALLVFAVSAFANHHKLNGTWKLIPNRGEFGGEPVIQTGTLTISDRDHNIYVSRNYTYQGANQTSTSSFYTDGRENSSIREGKNFKSKTKWEGDMLVVTTTQNNETAIERFNLEPDGTLKLIIDRAGHSAVTLFFQRGE